MAIKPKLQSLLASANDVTGEERTNLTDAVQDLVDGYGQGGDDEISRATSQYQAKILLANGSAVDTYSSNSHLKLLKPNFTDFIFNLSSAQQSVRVICKFKATSTDFNNWAGVLGDSYTSEPGTRSCGFYLFPNENNGFEWRVATASGYHSTAFNSLTPNAWYYTVIYIDKTTNQAVASLYDDNLNLIDAKLLVTLPSYYNNTSAYSRLGGYSGNTMLKGELNLTDICYLLDDVAVWGKLNSKTEKMGVYNFTNPANFTKVDWIESRNNAYALVNFIRNGSSNVSCECEFEVISQSGISFACGFGDNTSNTGGGCFVGSNNNKWTLLEPGVSYHEFGSNSLQNYSVTLSLSGNTATLSGDVFSSVTSSNYSTSASFNNKKSLIAQGYSSPIRVKKVVYKREGVTENIVYPCYHTETGIIGYFDSEINIFSPKSGAGEFVIPTDTSNEINLAEYLASLT